MTPETASTDLESLTRRLADAHKMASLGRLSAGIVHEINSPIGSIVSNNEVVLRSLEKLKRLLQDAKEQSAPLPQKAIDIVESITALAEVDRLACERISAVVRSLKTFARVNESDLRNVDINDLVRNTIKLTGAVFRARIAFETDLGELPEVECYPGLLNQVLLNLIVNAGQSIESEGTIAVRTRLQESWVDIDVSDTGMGIPPEVRPMIFTAGFTTKPLGEGTGLGLTITREIVEDTHGGKISFETEVGQGTTFHVRIPIKQPRSDKTNRSSA
jgi:signal transduction histidine kinase